MTPATTTAPTILVAGIGNIFLGDDAFGVEAARALQRRNLPSSILVKDFGIRGFDLAYALLDPWQAVILVDALARGETPGTLFVMEPDLAAIGSANSPDMAFNAHGMDPVRVINLAASIGDITAEIYIVGCEPLDFGDELEGRMGLSAPVEAAMEDACDMVERLVHRLAPGETRTHSGSPEAPISPTSNIVPPDFNQTQSIYEPEKVTP